MPTLFERLAQEWPPSTEKSEPATEKSKLPIELDSDRVLIAIHGQPHRSIDLKTIIRDILINGPAPATLVMERGEAHGFTAKANP
jgi:hypothetical protein